MKKSGSDGNRSEMLKRAVARNTGKGGSTPKEAVAVEGIKKKYFKTKDVCRVTFTLPGVAAEDATDVCIVGDFNNWDTRSDPMHKLRNGDYRINLDLYPGSEYQFRYLIDGSRWENDWSADRYVKTPFGDADNSVIII